MTTCDGRCTSLFDPHLGGFNCWGTGDALEERQGRPQRRAGCTGPHVTARDPHCPQDCQFQYMSPIGNMCCRGLDGRVLGTLNGESLREEDCPRIQEKAEVRDHVQQLEHDLENRDKRIRHLQDQYNAEHETLSIMKLHYGSALKVIEVLDSFYERTTGRKWGNG